MEDQTTLTTLPDQGLPLVTQESTRGGHPLSQAYVGTADDSGDKQTQ